MDTNYENKSRLYVEAMTSLLEQKCWITYDEGNPVYPYKTSFGTTKCDSLKVPNGLNEAENLLLSTDYDAGWHQTAKVHVNDQGVQHDIKVFGDGSVLVAWWEELPWHVGGYYTYNSVEEARVAGETLGFAL